MRTGYLSDKYVDKIAEEGEIVDVTKDGSEATGFR
jgi:hypothetical protein